MNNLPPSIFAERYPVAFMTGVVDLLLLLGASTLAYWLRFDLWEMNEWYLFAALTFSLTVVLSQVGMRCYDSWRGQALSRPLSRIIWAWVIALFILALIAIGTKLAHYFSRYWLLYMVALGFAAIISFRLCVYLLLSHVRRQGKNQKNVVIVSDASMQHRVFSLVEQLPAQGFSIRHTVAATDDAHFLVELASTVSLHKPHEVWICLPLADGDRIKEILHVLRHHLTDIRFIPDMSDLPLLNHQISYVAGMYAIDISCSPMGG